MAVVSFARMHLGCETLLEESSMAIRNLSECLMSRPRIKPNTSEVEARSRRINILCMKTLEYNGKWLPDNHDI
jgi:hypothetical protein